MTTTNEAAPAAVPTQAVVKQRTEVAAFDPNDPVALYMNTGLFDQLQRVASLMSKANVVPEHLRGEGKLADCFLVVSQAFRWGMDPFAVAQCTYVLKGKLGYEGKLIAAVVNVSGRLVAPLSYTYSGSGRERRILVSGQFRVESEARVVEGTVGQWATGNEQWTKAPDQMLAYRGAREWARRHMPEAVLGVQADDEVDVLDVTPIKAPDPVPTTMEQAKERLRESPPVVRAGVVEPEALRSAMESPGNVVPMEPEREPGSDDGEATPPPSHECFHQPIHGRAVSQGKLIVCPDCKAELTVVQLRAAEGRFAQQGGK